MNLEELLKDKKLPVKVRIPSWSSGEYFEAVSFNEYGAVGFFQDGRPYSWIFCRNDGWELYQEPKQKTVLHEYIVKFSHAAGELHSPYFFKSDEDFLTQFNGPIIKTGRTIEVELP